jgi:hypothetical protein
MDWFYRRRAHRWWRAQQREAEIASRQGCGCLVVIFAFLSLVVLLVTVSGSPYDRDGEPVSFGEVTLAALIVSLLLLMVLGIRAIAVARREVSKMYPDDD